MNNTTSSKIFGVPLLDVISYTPECKMPIVVKEMILYLLKNGLSYEGIFKKSLSIDQINYYKNLLDTTESCQQIINSLNPYIVASLLKVYLYELPGSLFPSYLYKKLINSTDNIDNIRQIILNEVPKPHIDLAKALFILFDIFIDNNAYNKLTQNEISIIFSDIIIRPDYESLNSVQDMINRCKFVLLLLKNYDKILADSRPKKTIISKFESPNLYKRWKIVSYYQEHLRKAFNGLENKFNDILCNINLDKLNEYNENEMNEILNEIKDKLQSNNIKISHPFPKNTQYSLCTTLVESAHTSLRGIRVTLEDRVTLLDNMNQMYSILSPSVNRAFYAVYDGHSGTETADLASTIIPRCIANEIGRQNVDYTKAIISGIKKADNEICDQALEQGFSSGSTLAMCLIVGETLYSANLGDSEIVLAKYDENKKGYEAIVLSEVHKPDGKERDRVTSLGAVVFRGRILGKLAVSRALGDIEFKTPKAKADFVSNDPYVQTTQLNENHEFIIIACDGLWDKISKQEAVDFVQERRNQNMSINDITYQLCEFALERGSKDNITVILIILKWNTPE